MGTPGWMGGANHSYGEDRPEYSLAVRSFPKQSGFKHWYSLDNRDATGDHPSQVCQARAADPNYQPESHADISETGRLLGKRLPTNCLLRCYGHHPQSSGRWR